MVFLFRSFLACVAISVIVATGVSSQEITVPLIDTPEGDLYPWITQLSSGPISWSGTPDSDDAGYFHRAVITTTEIYNDLFIERLTIGEEGFGKKLLWSRQMDAPAFAEAFEIRGEFAGLAVDRWNDSDTFLVSIQGRQFTVTVSARDTLLVEEIVQP